MRRTDTVYAYATHREPNGCYTATVTRKGPWIEPVVTSFQSGFAKRSAAYRYAVSMASAQARAAFASAQSAR